MAADGDVIEIITKRWNGDQPAREGDPSFALLYQRVFVNGREVESAQQSKVVTGPDFNYVVLRLAPGHLVVRDVDADEFDRYQPAQP
jgi:hypothetical protein